MSKSLGNVVLVHDLLKGLGWEFNSIGALERRIIGMNWDLGVGFVLRESKAQLDGGIRLSMKNKTSNRMMTRFWVALPKHAKKTLFFKQPVFDPLE